MFDKFKLNTKKLLQLHTAGATVRHKGRFSELEVLTNETPIDSELLKKYVAPFYMTKRGSPKYKSAYLNLRSDLNIELISTLFGEFNWRPRSVAAYFSALESMSELETNIGNLLLRSDVCYAGHNYCLALASFASSLSIDYLNQYLKYYLTKPELWFDQSSAMSALSYIGSCMDEDLLSPHMAAWEKFVKDKPNWDLYKSIDSFKAEMQSLNEFKREINS